MSLVACRTSSIDVLGASGREDSITDHLVHVGNVAPRTASGRPGISLHSAIHSPESRVRIENLSTALPINCSRRFLAAAFSIHINYTTELPHKPRCAVARH